jgi:hypothetical protein
MPMFSVSVTTTAGAAALLRYGGSVPSWPTVDIDDDGKVIRVGPYAEKGIDFRAMLQHRVADALEALA